MPKYNADATARNGAQPRRELTSAQLAAVPLLTAGATDAEAGEQLGIDRATVYRWRRFSPTFQAALNEARGEAGRLIGERLRAAATTALDAILDVLAKGDAPTRLKAAAMILDRAAFLAGPSDPAEIAALEEARRRRLAPDRTDELLATVAGAEGIAESRIRVWEELEKAAASGAGT